MADPAQRVLFTAPIIAATTFLRGTMGSDSIDLYRRPRINPIESGPIDSNGQAQRLIRNQAIDLQCQILGS
jgi:hypothetical protein